MTLAEEQIAAAKASMAKGDNERASYLLMRAKADAELALALAHEQRAIQEKQEVLERSKSSTIVNGATP